MAREDSACLGYDQIAASFDAERRPKPWEWPHFQRLAAKLSPGARVLDCGSGSGHLGLATLIQKEFAITALDGSAMMLELFRKRYPEPKTLLCDMRDFRPGGHCDAIIAWDSLFHLSHEDQAAMIGHFGRWLRPEGQLLFTSGPDHSIMSGAMFGTAFSYASFSEEEYRRLLEANGFAEIASDFDEPDARVHKVWSAEKIGG